MLRDVETKHVRTHILYVRLCKEGNISRLSGRTERPYIINMVAFVSFYLIHSSNIFFSIHIKEIY